MKNPICIITGSTLGNAEYVAEHVDLLLKEQGFKTALFNNATLLNICDYSQLLVVTSTYGAGELPENLQPLFEDLTSLRPDLSQIRFGVIGLGSSDYDTFCNAVNIVEEQLSSLGAMQICESLKIDVLNNFDHDSSAEAWLPNYLDALCQ